MKLTDETFGDVSPKMRHISSDKVRKNSYCFKDISTGMYLLELKNGTEETVEDKTYIEVISWRSEELSKAMSKFLRIRGFEEVDTESMDKDEFIASKDNFKATG